VREIVVRTETGETLRLLTNDLDAPAQEIADLYKRRWQIELFFRLMKQTLKITKFVGRSENAVRIQIAVALVAFLLLRALQKLTKETHGFLELGRLVRTNLMHRKDPTRPPKTAATTASRLPPTPTLLDLTLNRTAVGQARP
jgi:Transposase DDE domain